VCAWGGAEKVNESKEASRVCMQHGREREGTGVDGMSERRGIQGCA
jgi:hypothetical protein